MLVNPIHTKDDPEIAESYKPISEQLHPLKHVRNYKLSKSINTYFLLTRSATPNLVLEPHNQRWTPFFITLSSSANQWMKTDTLPYLY